jgi:hypothetical protein
LSAADPDPNVTGNDAADTFRIHDAQIAIAQREFQLSGGAGFQMNALKSR